MKSEQESLDEPIGEHFAGLKRDFLSQKQLFAYLQQGIVRVICDRFVSGGFQRVILACAYLEALTKPNLKNKESLRGAISIDSSAALGMTS